MTGWPVARKCFVACRFFEVSQQPTLPQLRHIRRSTQRSPARTHSSHWWVAGVRSRIWSRCVQVTTGLCVPRDYSGTDVFVAASVSSATPDSDSSNNDATGSLPFISEGFGDGFDCP